MSHGQRFTERGFSINKEVNDYNMLEESLTCQRVVYDALQACGKEIYEIEIDQELKKSCLLSCLNRDMKRKLNMDEITTMKRQKMTIQCSIEALKEFLLKQLLLWDLSLTAKAATFCQSLKDKEKTLKEYNDIILNLEKEYKAI